jgi:hypothetical protein
MNFVAAVAYQCAIKVALLQLQHFQLWRHFTVGNSFSSEGVTQTGASDPDAIAANSAAKQGRSGYKLCTLTVIGSFRSAVEGMCPGSAASRR